MDSDLTGQADLATGAAQPANPYLDLLQGERQQADTALRANLTSAVGVNPEQFAKAKRTADYLGYPIAAVQAMPQVEQQAQVQQITQGLQGAPALQRAYSNADFAKLAHDDHSTLASIEHALLYAVGGQNSGVGDAPEYGGASLAGDAARSLGSFAARVAKVPYAAIGAAPVLYDKAASLVTGHDTSSASDWYFENTLKPLDDYLAKAAQPADAPFARKAVSAVGELVGTLGTIYATGGAGEAGEAAQGANSVAEFLKGALAHTTRAMAVPATADAVNTYQNVFNQTGNANDAAKAAITQYGVSTMSGMMPLSAPGGLATRLTTGFAAGAVSGEASREAMNAVLPEGMHSEFNVDDTVLSGLMGMGMAGVIGPRNAPSFHAAVRQTYVDAAHAAQAEEGAQHLETISQLAQSSSLRQRDPETFKKTIAAMTENPDSLQAVYIKGDQFDQALAQSGVSPDDLAKMMPHVADQLGQARATGGDVRIPIEDFATHLAGSPIEAAITPHLRVDPDGMTFAESQEVLKNQSQGLKDQAAQLVEGAGQDEARANELSTIHDNILGQITATGRYRPEVAKAYAGLTRSYYDTTSERVGMSPSELFAKHPLYIEGERSSSATAIEQRDALQSSGSLMRGPADADAVSVKDAKGLYTPATNTITSLKDADLSTFLHELGHHFLETHTRIASSEGAPEGIVSDLQTFLDHVGSKDTPAEWAAKSVEDRRSAHETFARSFEQYLMEGKAPSMEMQGLFSRFRSWLISVYHELSGLVGRGANLSPEVRGVMDRMLASDQAIDEAQRTRGMLSMEKAPEGTTDKQFQAYQNAGAEATAQAKADMTARSLRDMRWISNAKTFWMKGLQKEAREARAKIETAVGAQVREMPVYKAKAELDDRENGQSNAIKQHGVARDKAVEDAKREAGAAKLKGAKAKDFVAKLTTAWDEAHPEPSAHPTGAELDMVAEQHGYASGEDMLRSIAEAEPQKDVVQGLTDQRMLEEHGELTDPVSIERAAEASIHNEARARFMATGLKMLTKSPVSPTQLAKAAKEAAESAVNAKPVKDLHPKQYAAAEKRANRDVLKLAPKDIEGAAKAQREALLNNQLFTAATKAIEDVRKGLDYLKRFDRASMREKMALDIRDQVDEMLDRFDLRKTPPDDDRLTRQQQNLADWIKAQQEAGYQPSVSPEALDSRVRIHYADMSVEQFRGLVDSVKALEQVGQQRQTITIDGKKVELDAFVGNELVPKMAERGEKFTPDELLDKAEDRLTNPFAIALDHFQSWLRAAAAQLKPQEFKRNQYDRHELLGPFGRGLFEPVINAAYRKVDMLKGLSEDFKAVADSLGREWQDSLRESVKQGDLPDPDKPGAPLRLTRGRMVGIALHVGNESNFAKLTKGWGWKPEAVLRFLSENMTVKDWHAVQSVWDLYEKHWPDTEAMYRRLGQTIPEKIAARPFTVRSAEGADVNMRGGYAAITYDPLRSRRGEKAAAGQAIDPGEGLFGRDYFSRKTTTNGSMNVRAEGYTDRVNLDFHDISQKLRESIHDLAYRETLMDVHKIIEHPEFRKAFRTAYGREAHQSLQDWIGNLANSENQDRQVGALGKFLQYTRTGMVINAIAFRATTVLKHGGSAGIKTLGYFAGGGEKYLGSRMAAMTTDYRNQIASAKDKFPEIRARLMQQDRDFQATSHALFEPESKLAQAERFGHAAVAWSDMMTAVPTAWAAYDRAIAEGIPKSQGGTGAPMTEEQAVNYANKIVREAHGSLNEAGRSMVMSSRSEAVKMFTTLYGFMNTTYGQQLDAFDKLQTKGISAAPVLARTLMAVIVPSLWATLLSGGPDKDKQEGWGGWTAKAIGGEVASSVPFVRDVVSMFEGYSHAGQVAAESWLATMVKAATDTYHAATNPDAKGAVVKDVANAAGMGLHIPGLGQAGTTLQYIRDLQSGKAHPQGAWEMTKGLVTGHDGEK